MKIIMKTLIMLLLINLVSACGWLEEMPSEASNNETTVIGTVVENNQSCAADAICYLLVDTADGQWRVVYGTGERLPVAGEELCQTASESTQLGWSVEVGAQIEAFGRIRAENEIGLCYQGAYTLFVRD